MFIAHRKHFSVDFVYREIDHCCLTPSQPRRSYIKGDVYREINIVKDNDLKYSDPPKRLFSYKVVDVTVHHRLLVFA